MNKEELTKKVRDLKELKTMAEELQAEITAIEDTIKAEMTEQNVNELQVGIFKVRWTPVKSNRFDTKAFQGKYQDLYNQFLKVVESRRFTIA
jgi:predicted phage-related endonuclease